MSRIDDLVAELAPDGVPFVPLGELLDYEQPGKYLVESTQYDDGYPIPVLTAGQTFILGYTDEEDGIYPASRESPVIIFDDFTTAFRWVDFPFKAKSSAMKMLTPKPDAPALFKYIHYAMLCIRFTPQDHARHWIAKHAALRVPVPPLEVQAEIVRILDSFQQLEAELEAELEARRCQFIHYRDEALAAAALRAERIRLAAVADINWGDTSTTKNAYVTSGARYLAFSAAGPDGFLDHYDYERAGVVISAIGALAGKTWRATGRWSCIKNTLRMLSIDEAVACTDYLYWVTSTPHFWPRRGSAQPFITKGDADAVEIPLPPIQEQRRIAAIFDSCDALVNDLSSGLPAEIAARRQQYQHYRDRLLTFEALSS